MYEAPYQITLNQTLQSQTKASIARSSCEICALLGYYAAQSDNSLPTFQDNLSGTSSKVNKLKRENWAPLMLNDTIFFQTLSINYFFLKKRDVLEAGSVSIFRQRST